MFIYPPGVSDNGYGVIMVYYNNTWGYVCDDVSASYSACWRPPSRTTCTACHVCGSTCAGWLLHVMRQCWQHAPSGCRLF